METVEVVEGEHVVPRGTAKTFWFVRVGDGWTRAPEIAGARVQALEPSPGVVWQNRIELELARGTRLMCVRSTPHPVKRQPLEYLQSSTSTRRRVVRSLHRVSWRGLVIREPDRNSRA